MTSSTDATSATHLDHARLAARDLLCHWQAGTAITQLPPDYRPQTRAQGYLAQRELMRMAGNSVPGWKIAATSVAGQQHIHVSGPLAGAIHHGRVHTDGASISLRHNRMRVAECEMAFVFARRLVPRSAPYSHDEALATLATIHPAIEVPDSRFSPFEAAGEAQLIADNACSRDFVLGRGMAIDARVLDLAQHTVHAQVSDGRMLSGTGANVLGDPLVALVWFIHELSAAGITIEPGQFVTTGACVTPIPIEPGQTVDADFGWLGRMTVRFGG